MTESGRRLLATSIVVFLPVVTLGNAAAPTGHRDLTQGDRVAAERAILRVYHAHQIGAPRSADETLTDALLAARVRTYLQQSVALERFWATPVTADMLARELQRMEHHTRMPERLRELYGALGNDRFLAAETLARPALVARLTRSFFSYDQSIHAAARREAQALRDALVRGTMDPGAEHPRRTVLEILRGADDEADAHDPSRLSLPAAEFEKWRSRLPSKVREIGPLREDAGSLSVQVVLDQSEDASRVATYSVRKRTWEDWWADSENGLDPHAVEAVGAGEGPLSVQEAGASSPGSCPIDTWDNGALDDGPLPRAGHAAVWTGSVMLFWGGRLCPFSCDYFDTGFAYDPATDTMTPIATLNAPSPRFEHTAVWTGQVMVVWGGAGVSAVNVNTGGRYDPGTNTWAPTSILNAPSARNRHTAVWTGAEMIVWGGGFNTGGRYDPVNDLWTSTSTTNAPAARSASSAIWTGDRMVIWGGQQPGGPTGPFEVATGGRYDPSTDAWTPTSMVNAPSPRQFHTATWTGSRMIVWGGDSHPAFGNPVPLANGGSYDPAADTWGPVSTAGAPVARTAHSAAWTGSTLLVWGGRENSNFIFGTGGRYDPLSDTWAPMTSLNAPSRRSTHAAVWTGTLLVVWGGVGFNSDTLDTGGRYDPSSNSWTPTTLGGAPAGRSKPTGVWTGTQMIVWGGTSPLSSFLNTGGRYDPALDTWTMTSAPGNVPGLSDHVAVWTGNRMIVWGGRCSNDGALYDPLTDTWTRTSNLNAASPKCSGHSAVWTGSEMIIWGSSTIPQGGRYSPTTDTWAPVSNVNAPGLNQYQHTATWTGHDMIVWGGAGCSGGCPSQGTGARYDPATDTWTPLSSVGAPSARRAHTAVWTGTEMIVWGGIGSTGGGRYNPATDTWSAMSNAASNRWEHKAAWTGDTMVVWGGSGAPTTQSNSGDRYNPVLDTWSPTSLAGAPTARQYNSLVWTGGFVIVWGGYDGSYSNDGGRYCACASQLYYADSDGDGYGDPGHAIQSCGAGAGTVDNSNDCNDAAAGLWSTPGEARNAGFSDASTLVWDPPADPGAGFLTYDVLRSESASDFVSAATCIATDDPAATTTDPAEPEIGHAFFYLVRAQNGCPAGQGTLGTDSSGTVRSGRSCP